MKKERVIEISFDVVPPEGMTGEDFADAWLEYLSLSKAMVKKIGVVVRSPEMNEVVRSDAPRSEWPYA